VTILPTLGGVPVSRALQLSVCLSRLIRAPILGIAVSPN
jgi:hypothetical protein